MDIRHILNNCILCPRKCGVDRTSGHTGACHMTDTVRVSRAAYTCGKSHVYPERTVQVPYSSPGCALGCLLLPE